MAKYKKRLPRQRPPFETVTTRLPHDVVQWLARGGATRSERLRDLALCGFKDKGKEQSS